MYYYLRGRLVLCSLSTAVVDCGGVGYRLTVSATTIGKMAGKIGEEVTLYTYLAVREDAMELFGFYSEDEYRAYKMLINVSGVGPKAAISILSALPPERLAAAIVSGDTKLISRAQGIGAKTAARVVLELKDKVAKELGAEIGSPVPEVSDQMSTQTASSGVSDALAALMVLGYTRQEAMSALRGLDPTKDCEALVREALKKLFNPDMRGI